MYSKVNVHNTAGSFDTWPHFVQHSGTMINYWNKIEKGTIVSLPILRHAINGGKGPSRIKTNTWLIAYTIINHNNLSLIVISEADTVNLFH